MQGAIYCFTNTINQKQYIGSTIVSPLKRKKQHLYDAFYNQEKKSYPLYQAFRKYGVDSFIFEVLEQHDWDSEIALRDTEKEYIIKHNSLSPNGYNQTLDTRHPINDPVTYKKIRETKREKAKCIAEIDQNHNIINTYRSIVDCAEILHISEKSIAACCRGESRSADKRYFCWINENNQLLLPEYTGVVYKGIAGTTQIHHNSKKIQQFDLQTHKLLNTYDTAALAARENHCDRSGIIKVCRGNRKSCGNYFWKYAEEKVTNE